MKGYGESWQLSVFHCILKEIDLVRLERDLREVMNLSVDQTLIIDLGLDTDRADGPAKVLGIPLPESPERVNVV